MTNIKLHDLAEDLLILDRRVITEIISDREPRALAAYIGLKLWPSHSSQFISQALGIRPDDFDIMLEGLKCALGRLEEREDEKH